MVASCHVFKHWKTLTPIKHIVFGRKRWQKQWKTIVLPWSTTNNWEHTFIPKHFCRFFVVCFGMLTFILQCVDIPSFFCRSCMYLADGILLPLALQNIVGQRMAIVLLTCAIAVFLLPKDPLTRSPLFCCRRVEHRARKMCWCFLVLPKRFGFGAVEKLWSHLVEIDRRAVMSSDACCPGERLNWTAVTRGQEQW